MDDSDIPTDEDGNKMILPFICVKGNGGHLDDKSFQAGWTLSRVWQLLDRQGHMYQIDEVVETDLLPQLDLIVMHFEATMEPLGSTGQWTTVRISSSGWLP